MFHKALTALRLAGLDLKASWQFLSGWPRYVRDLSSYRRLNRHRDTFRFRWRDSMPLFGDFASSAGTAKGHYFYQDLWAARKIFARRPESHLDIGSRIDGFVAHVLTFMPVTLVDIRKLESSVDGLSFIQDDATSLDQFEDRSICSLSSLHVVEHFGLGRYGDPIDPDGSFKAMASMQRVLAPGGHLYFSVPVGRERVAFNAHRVFAPETIVDAFGELELVSFAAVLDDDSYRPDATLDLVAGSHFACGMFEFRRHEPASG